MNGPERFEAYDGDEGENDHDGKGNARDESGIRNEGGEGGRDAGGFSGSGRTDLPEGPGGPDAPGLGGAPERGRPPRIPMPRASVEDGGLPLPAPAEPKKIFPGRSFATAISSFSVLTPRAGVTTRTPVE